MIEYNNQTFVGGLIEGNKLYQSIKFSKCSFLGVAIALDCRPNKRTRVVNVSINDCKQRNVLLGAAQIEDTLVENLQSGSLIIADGTLFRHVVLRKAMGRIMFRDFFSLFDPATNVAFERANAEFYKSVDWALDISEAEFVECDMRDVPVELIRRDPENEETSNVSSSYVLFKSIFRAKVNA